MIPVINLSILGIAKIFALIALAIYIVFGLVVVKQVNLMVETLEVGFEAIIKLIAWAHLIFAVFVFLAALIVL